MKWENCDINVLGRANMQKFRARRHSDSSQASRIIIWGCISWYDSWLRKLYSHRKKADISFEIANEKIRFFLSMLPLSGCHKLLDRKMYWETTRDTFV